MVLIMPTPVLIGNTYYLRVRVPSDLLASAKGQSVTVPVGDSFKKVKITDFVKVSLETRDPRMAKERFANPLATIERPDFQTVASDARTYTMDEAKLVLAAARKETRYDLRWLPWMCAYSGARIEEVAQLSKSNFFKVGDDWFLSSDNLGR